MIFRSKLFFSFFLFLTANSFSQKQTNSWHFGTLAGIDFNSGSPVAINASVLNTNEGCSSACDASGILLFYTDGVTVWDKTNTQMPNGNNLDGDASSTQSALVVPVPGSTTQYYIFTVDYIVGPKGFEYSIVDMTLNGGKGDVVTTTKNTLIKNSVCEKQCAVYHCNGTDIWVMVHDWNSNKFYAYLVTGSGINAPVISAAGTKHDGSSTNNSIGQMKFSPDGKRIACAIGYKDTVNIFDFDSKTGIVSNADTLALGNHVYGIEFSPNSSLLYVSYYQIGNAGWVSQFDLTAANVQASQTVLGTSFDPNYIYALQQASDGKIYCATEVTPWIGVINSPNTVGAGCNYVVQGFNVDPSSNGYYCMLGLPNFIASYFYPGFPTIPACANLVGNFSSSDTVLCKNECINFIDNSSGSPTSWSWNFPGANTTTSTVQNPTNICYPNAGTFTVTEIISDGTNTDTVKNIITVSPGPTANAGADVTIPAGSNTTLNATGGGNYLWSPTTSLSCFVCPNPVANPVTTTAYSVTVTDTNGCSSVDSVIVFVESLSANCFEPYVADAFSPNDDGLNDVLYVHAGDLKSLSFAVYDRLGEKVFETSSASIGWDGTYKGRKLEPAVFVWYLKAICNSNKEFDLKGNITLFR